MTSPIEHVETLARALDDDDYTVAASVLAEGVEYTIGGEVLIGPEAVVASYREASEMARRLFDEVEYHHRVISTDDPHFFRVSYSDRLTVGAETLTHMAEQHLRVGSGQGIVEILNVDVPGEREKVDEFMARHGLSRES